jgi:hypothetical protein
MSCILRAYGRRFDVERYLVRSRFRPIAVHRRGAPVFPASQPKGRKYERSGCSIEVSRRDFHDFAGQLRDAVRFLRANAAAVRALRRFPGVESAILDFGVAWRDVAAHGDVLPEDLIELAGRCHLSLKLSHYPVKTSGRALPRHGRPAGRRPGAKAPHNNKMQLTSPG